MRASWISILCFLLPSLLLILPFYIFPAFQTFHWSFYEWSLLSPDRAFVGLKNYFELFLDPRFWRAYQNLLLWMILFPALSVVFGLSLALIQNASSWGSSFLRLCFILPMTISYTAGGIIWIFMYNPDFGTIQLVLNSLGLSGLNQNWLSDPKLVNFALIFSASWLWSGFSFIIFRAGLTNVPKELHEAAMVDGANVIQRFFHVTLPSLKASFTVVLGMSLLYALRVFDLIFSMTRGGPGIASEVPALLLWRQAFEFEEAGRAMANAILLSMFSLGVVLIMRFFIRAKRV